MSAAYMEVCAMYNRFTGGYEYWIAMTAGCHVVKRIWEGSDSEPEVVFKGSYSVCRHYIDDTIRANYEYDNDI